jgi:hypothetical protein
MSSQSFAKATIRGALLVSLLAIVSSAAIAADSKVTLSGKEETPPVATAASGVAEIKVSADKKVSGAVKTTGVEGTAGHIHLGAAGEKGPPVITLDKGSDGAWTVPEGATLNDEQYAAYKAGKLYVNIHSAANKGGEIRGQLKP